MKKESHNAEMKKTLLIYLFVFLGFFVCFGSFIAQTINPWSINPVISLNTSGNDVPFGVDSSYVYLKQDGEHLRSSRVSNPEHPGVPEKVSIVAIRDDAWDELGEIQHVCIDDARGLAVISARPYPGATNYDLFISSTLPSSRFKNDDSSISWSKSYPLASLRFTVSSASFPCPACSVSFCISAAGTKGTSPYKTKTMASLSTAGMA